VGILGCGDPRRHGVHNVHLWAYDALLDAIPDAEWLVKHRPRELNGSLFRQVWWQRRKLPVEARAHNVDILLNTDAGTVCRAHPAVTMSRDMMSYEAGAMRRYFPSRMWLRLLALRYIQARSLKDADGAIFLTRYAAKVIQRMTGPLPRVAIIPHGIGQEFRRERTLTHAFEQSVRCIYVSQADLYKHQWCVVRAIADLRRRGHDVKLLLAGGGEGRAQRLLDEELVRSDPKREFVTQIGFVRATDLPAVLAEADLFIFASSCENMPNTLVEGMASALPIASSDRGPMPEVLRDGGVYFDPENPGSIVSAVEKLLVDPALRASVASRAEELSNEYSWERCASETWAFLRRTLVAVRASATTTRDESRLPEPDPLTL
jgi:glycosyltransferase involved in cell wall biosynthesis